MKNTRTPEVTWNPTFPWPAPPPPVLSPCCLWSLPVPGESRIISLWPHYMYYGIVNAGFYKVSSPNCQVLLISINQRWLFHCLSYLVLHSEYLHFFTNDGLIQLISLADWYWFIPCYDGTLDCLRWEDWYSLPEDCTDCFSSSSGEALRKVSSSRAWFEETAQNHIGWSFYDGQCIQQWLYVMNSLWTLEGWVGVLVWCSRTLYLMFSSHHQSLCPAHTQQVYWSGCQQCSIYMGQWLWRCYWQSWVYWGSVDSKMGVVPTYRQMPKLSS